MPATKVEKHKWLKLGIKRFSISGIQGINVEQMSKTLNCNKSSFYWHFKTKKMFLREVIQYWFENSVNPITTELSKDYSANERFEKFITISFKDKSRKDLMNHLRKLSQTDTKISEILNNLTSKRLTFICLLIQDLGYNKKEAKVKSEILLNFYIGWYETHKYETSNSHKEIKHAIELIKNFINF